MTTSFYGLCGNLNVLDFEYFTTQFGTFLDNVFIALFYLFIPKMTLI